MRIGKTIYLDHQATTTVDPKVAEAMLPFLSEFFGNPHSSEHILGWQASKAIDKARLQISTAISSSPNEIIFTSGATESNNLAILGCTAKQIINRNKVFISPIEHKSVLAIAEKLEEKFSYIVEFIPVNSFGTIDLNWLEANLDENVLLTSVVAVSNEIGTIQPLEEIGKLTSKTGTLFHTDASQALSAMKLDVDLLNIDLLSLSSHKIYGPKGIGALYIRQDLQKHLEPLFYGGGQENGLRPGTLPTPLCVGFGHAIELQCQNNHDEEFQKLQKLRTDFLEGLDKLQHSYSINGPCLKERHPGNINICFHGFVAQDVLMALQPRLAASSGSACTSGIVEPSYVLRAIGLSNEEAESSIRFSFGRYTTEADVVDAIEQIDSVLINLSS